MQKIKKEVDKNKETRQKLNGKKRKNYGKTISRSTKQMLIIAEIENKLIKKETKQLKEIIKQMREEN